MAIRRMRSRGDAGSGGWRRRLRDDAGDNLVEFALASSLFFLVFFGIIELGVGIWHYNMISNLAQEGARWASVRGSNATALGPASAANVEAFVRGRAQGINLTTVTTTPVPSGITTGAVVTVTVSETYTMGTAFLPFASLPLTATAKMVMAR